MTTLQPGTMVGRYRIIFKIGSGSVGDVYEAEESDSERHVALKILAKWHAQSQETVQRFLREAESAATLNHRGIVQIYEVGYDDALDVHYISMRLLTGGNLGSRAFSTMSAGEALVIARELADAFQHAHSRGVIHRDLKPSNVLFDEQGFPLLTDFGITKALGSVGLTATGTTSGTATYMSPDQVSGKPCDERSDLYSLGALLYEMIRGRPPYVADTDIAVMFQHLTAPIPPLPAPFRRLEPLVHSLLAKNPDERPSSAAELVIRIDGLIGRAGLDMELPRDRIACSQLMLRGPDPDESRRARVLELAYQAQAKYIRYGRSIEELPAPWWKRWLPTKRPETAADPVDCSLFGPQEVSPGADSVIQAVLHLPKDFIEADRLAKDIDPMTHRRGRKRLEMEVSRGARIQFHLQAHDLSPEPAVQDLTWKGIIESVQFRIRAPSDPAVTSCVARLQVDVDGIPVGVIQFPIRVLHPMTLTQNTSPASPRAYRFRKAFISYAKEDRIEVLKCVQVLPKVGIDFYQDILHVEPGERWEQSLYKHIDTSDVFLLFWSQVAKQSQWVMKEVEYALRRSTDGPDYLPEIRPVMLEGPPPVQPPDWLAHLHFNDPLTYVLSGERASTRPNAAKPPAQSN